MNLKISLPDQEDFSPRILVIGVGGAGGNAINNMINSGAIKVDFLAVNTDSQVLNKSLAKDKIQLGSELTHGLGAGANPDIGRRSAEMDIDKIEDILRGYHMCFITAGMGGGTGTGASPVIAAKAKEMNILTVGVVTKPFDFEGYKRGNIAKKGLEDLQKYVDTLIVIPNQKLFLMADKDTTFAEAFAMADGVLSMGVKGITDLMIVPGLINLDFADLRTVMNERGKAMMGTGWGEGADKALDAAHGAIANPLLDDISLQGATAAIVNITGGYDMKLAEVDAAASYIKDQIDPDAQIIVGSTFDESLKNRMCVSIVATGIDKSMLHQKEYDQDESVQNMDRSQHRVSDHKEDEGDQKKSSDPYSSQSKSGNNEAQGDECKASEDQKNADEGSMDAVASNRHTGSYVGNLIRGWFGTARRNTWNYVELDMKNNEYRSTSVASGSFNDNSCKSRVIPDYFKKNY